jgi:hypothetical protein
MNIEEARKVLWLKSNPRPLGELLDAGYLTEDRLKWAAEKAYDPKLKEAARVLMQEDQAAAPASGAVPIEIGISLDKAQRTPWPFAPYKGRPMGALVASGQLTLRDLGFAAETAWDPQVRRAAATLSLVRLERSIKEPAPPAGPLHVFTRGRSHAEKSQLRLTLLQGVIFGVVFGLALAYLVWAIGIAAAPGSHSSLANLVSPSNGFAALLALIVLALIVSIPYYLMNRTINQLDNQVEKYRLGQEGEDRVVELLLQALNGDWYLFRNVSLPGPNKGDLDIVLLGPPGIWALEIKNFHGEYRNVGEVWQVRHRTAWKGMSKSPSRQARNNAIRLANFLKADGLSVFVNGVVIWANQESSPTVENPAVAVWTCDRLWDEIGNAWQGTRIADPDRTKIVDKLTKLCQAN